MSGSTGHANPTEIDDLAVMATPVTDLLDKDKILI